MTVRQAQHRPGHLRLGVNIDHVATVRNARGAGYPDPVRAGLLAAKAGADGITAHLREDRRHITDDDIARLSAELPVPLNFEMAATEEMLEIALDAKPDAVTLVAENPNEITTEGGLDVKANIAIVRAAVAKLRQGQILTSLFVDPDPLQIEVAHEVGAQQVELCTAAYAEATLGARGIHGEGAAHAAQELRRLRDSAELATQYGLNVAAGHGLTAGRIPAGRGRPAERWPWPVRAVAAAPWRLPGSFRAGSRRRRR